MKRAILGFLALTAPAFAAAGPGPLTVQILTQPERVEAFRIAVPVHGDRKQLSTTHEWIGEYLVVQSAGTGPRRESAAQIAGSLLSSSAIGNRCAFQPGFAIRYWRGTRSATLLFCFHCMEFRVIPPAGSGESAFGGDFSRASTALVKFLRAGFPDDGDLAALDSARSAKRLAVVMIYAPFIFALSGDSPRLVLYDDGTFLQGELLESGEMQYRVSVFAPDEFRRLRQSIGSMAAFRLLNDSYNVAPGIADLPGVALILSDDSGTKAVAVTGYSFDGTSRRPNGDAVPHEFERIVKLLWNLKPANTTPWTPKYVEVMLTPAGAPAGSVPHWPAKWPWVDDRLAFRRGEEYSVILPGSHLTELRALVKRSRTVVRDGKTWTIAYRQVVPDGTVDEQIHAHAASK